jgi:hypothetical protein
MPPIRIPTERGRSRSRRVWRLRRERRGQCPNGAATRRAAQTSGEWKRPAHVRRASRCRSAAPPVSTGSCPPAFRFHMESCLSKLLNPLRMARSNPDWPRHLKLTKRLNHFAVHADVEPLCIGGRTEVPFILADDVRWRHHYLRADKAGQVTPSRKPVPQSTPVLSPKPNSGRMPKVRRIGRMLADRDRSRPAHLAEEPTERTPRVEYRSSRSWCARSLP